MVLFFRFELKIAVHTAKSVKSTTFLRRVNFILMFFLEELAPLLSAGKPFSNNLEGLKVTIPPQGEPWSQH